MPHRCHDCAPLEGTKGNVREQSGTRKPASLLSESEKGPQSRMVAFSLALRFKSRIPLRRPPAKTRGLSAIWGICPAATKFAGA